MEFRQKVQDVIINYKRTHNVSRSEMARRLGVPYSSLQDWENGKTMMSAEAFLRLLELTEAPVEQFQPESEATPIPA